MVQKHIINAIKKLEVLDFFIFCRKVFNQSASAVGFSDAQKPHGSELVEGITIPPEKLFWNNFGILGAKISYQHLFFVIVF